MSVARGAGEAEPDAGPEPPPAAPGAEPDSGPAYELEAVPGPGAEPEPEPEPAPWGASLPWWSAERNGGTGPHAVPDGGGAHPPPFPSNGTGPHVMPNGTGPFPAVPPSTPPGSGPGERKQVPGLLLGAGVGAFLVVALMAGMLAFGSGGGTKGGGGPGAASKRRIAVVAVAGGLHRDPGAPPAASAAYPFVAAAVRAGGVPVGKDGVAVYADAPGGAVNVLFMGGTGAVGDPVAFLREIRPTTVIATQNAEAGGEGGRALCGSFAVLAAVHTYCAWATKDSYGVVASNTPVHAAVDSAANATFDAAAANQEIPVLADIMRRIRQDVERPRR